MAGRPCECGKVRTCGFCHLYATSEFHNRLWGGDGVTGTKAKGGVSPRPAKTLPCIHRGEFPVDGTTRQRLGLSHSRDWYTCALGHGTAGHVCECRTYPLGCKACPDRNKPATPPPVVRVDATKLSRDGIAFNCSLIDYKGRRLFAYRTGWGGANVHVCELGPDLQPRSESVTLHRLYHADRANYGREDPRLFVFRGRLHVSYTGVQATGKKIATHQLYARLTDRFEVEAVFAPPNPEPGRWQKNWVYFEAGGELYCVYSVSPHVVLKLDGDRVTDEYRTDNPHPWSGGHLRGGASPVAVGDSFLHFFHGAVDLGPAWPTRRYNVGAYVFEGRPPFRVVRQTADPILTADPATRPADQYADVVFPGGAVREGDGWRMACGVHDRWPELRAVADPFAG